MSDARSSTATATTATVKRGRFAPSPTGRLHLGSLVAAVGSYLDARHSGAEWLVRIEDIDRAREVPGAAADILATLDAFGLHWDGAVLYQHTRIEAYRAVLDDLKREGAVYPCDCVRSRYAATTEGEARYPGLCRHRHLNLSPSTAVAWRLNTHGHPPITVKDRAQGVLTQDVEAEVGDFVLWRKDRFPAYQLAVVLDDALQGITEIVRGVDLWDNTPRQRLLQARLKLPSPTTLHLPLVLSASGDKLSKSRAALPVERSEMSKTLATVLALLSHPVPQDLLGAPPETLLAHASHIWDANRLTGQRSVVGRLP